MTPQELNQRLTAVEADTATWATHPGEWHREDVDDALEVWDRLDRLIDSLMALRHDYAHTLARRLPDQYTGDTHNGRVTVHRTVDARHRWDGHGLVEALSRSLIDPDTGEVTRAIPTEVAAAVIPACGQGQTSSKWKISEVRKHVQADDFHKVTYGDALIARGPLAYQARNTKPTGPPPASPADAHT